MDHEERLDMLSMYDDRAAPFVDLVPPDERFKSFHLLEVTGIAHSKGAGVIAILSILDRTRAVGRLLAALKLSWLLTGLYSVVSSGRGFLGRLVPDAPGPTRLRD